MGQTAQLAVQQTSQISHEALQSSLIFLIQIPSYLYPGGPGMNGFHPNSFIYTYGIYEEHIPVVFIPSVKAER